MSTVGSTANTAFSDLGLAVKQTQKVKQQLGQDDFLTLMTTQLKYQDPFKPMDNGAFLGQMAQFSTVSGIQSLQTSFSTLASSLQSSQALQSSGLVGRSVLVPSATGYLSNDRALEGAADLSSGGSLTVEISDASGQVVRHLDLGTQSAGMAPFSWDGLSDLGVVQPSGHYQIKALVGNGGAQQSASTFAIGKVGGVTIGSSGLTLELQGMDAVAFSNVRQIF